MKILILDHSFHQHTRSSNFFLEIVREHFEVELLYVSTERESAIRPQHPLESYDLVLLWQLDYLAPYFLARGIRTVVVPMYDGSATLPQEHWQASCDARFVSFSRTLHDRIGLAGGESLAVRYFLPPCAESELPDFSTLRGVLWMRRPQDNIHPRAVAQMLGDQLHSLHVHNAPDDGMPRLLRSSEYWTDKFPITESRWSEEASPFREALQKASVFIAPRPSEGIGMAMLEAVSRGLLVLANDDSVHDEYIANWINGVLFRKDNPQPFSLDPAAARELAYCGWQGGRAGYQQWLEGRDAIAKFIRETPAPAGFRQRPSEDFLATLWSSFLAGTDAYRAFLQRNVLPEFEAAGNAGEARPVPEYAALAVDDDGLFFGYNYRGVADANGFDGFDVFTSWIGDNSATFRMRVGDVPRTPLSIQLEGELAGDLQPFTLGLMVNGQFLGMREIQPVEASFTAIFDVKGAREGEWQLQVLLQRAANAPASREKLRVGLTRIAVGTHAGAKAGARVAAEAPVA